MTTRFSSLFSALQKEHDRFVLWLPVLFGLGIGIYYLFPYEPDITVTVIICAVFSLLLALVRKKMWGRVFFVCLLFIALGMLRAEIRTQIIAAPVLGEEIFFRAVQGQIKDIQIKEKGKKIYLSSVTIEGIDKESTPKYISVSLKEVQENLTVGDWVELSATLFPPPTPVMPRAYDFARMFYYQQLGAVGYTPKPVIVLRKASPDSFEQKLNKLRLSLTSRILAPMDKENGWIAAALMVGEMSGVSEELSDIMRNSGIYHVLSISGLHMSLAAMLVFFTVRFLLTLYPPFAMQMPIKKIAAFVALLSSFAYLLLAGYPVPAVRSFIMVACVMVAILFDRTGISVFSLAWAAMITLLWQPESLLGASFQLSFAATIAILAFYERYSGELYKTNMGYFHKVRLYFLIIMLTSLVATLATTPMVIYNFNRFTVWGIVANMLLLPLVSFWIMPAAVIAFLLMPFELEYYPLVVLDYGISLMVEGARFLAALPYASISLPSPSFWGIMLAVFGGLWLCIWQQKWRLLGVPFIIIGTATFTLHQPYDLLISSDASKVALRLDDSRFLFLRGKDDSFDAEVWLRSNGQENGVPIEEMAQELGTCDKHKCMVTAYGKKIVTTKGKQEIETSCDGNPDIVISKNYLYRVAGCENVPLLIDAGYLDRNGATAVRFRDGITQIENSIDYRGDRLWVNR